MGTVLGPSLRIAIERRFVNDPVQDGVCEPRLRRRGKAKQKKLGPRFRGDERNYDRDPEVGASKSPNNPATAARKSPPVNSRLAPKPAR